MALARARCSPGVGRPRAPPRAAPPRLPSRARPVPPWHHDQLPLLEARGLDYDIGRAAGRRFAGEIRAGFADRAAWFRDLKAFADSLPRRSRRPSSPRPRVHARSLGRPARAGRRQRRAPARPPAPEPQPRAGRHAGEQAQGQLRAVAGLQHRRARPRGPHAHCHNEDGNAAYLGRMFMLRAEPTGRPGTCARRIPACSPETHRGSTAPASS